MGGRGRPQRNLTTTLFPVLFALIATTIINKYLLDAYLRKGIVLGSLAPVKTGDRHRLTLNGERCSGQTPLRTRKHPALWSGGSHLVTRVFTRLHSTLLPQKDAGRGNTVFLFSCFITTREGVGIKKSSVKWTIHTSSEFLKDVGSCCCLSCSGCRCLEVISPQGEY